MDQNGNSRRLKTATRGGTQNPNWSQALDFETRSWRYLKVRVYDEDSSYDDALSNGQTRQIMASPVHAPISIATVAMLFLIIVTTKAKLLTY